MQEKCKFVANNKYLSAQNAVEVEILSRQKYKMDTHITINNNRKW